MAEVVRHERSAWHRSTWECDDSYCVRHKTYRSKCQHKSGWHQYVRCRKRLCRGCGRWWSSDNRAKIRRNMATYSGHTAIVTVTAPGQDRLPYDPATGRCEATTVAAWNYLAPRKWRDLHRIASQRAKRAAQGERWCVLVKVWQEQRRGALHVHLVVPMSTELERAASREYVQALCDNAHRYDFGYVDRKLELRSPEKSAGYIARYVASELAMCRELPGHVVDVARRLTSATGVTVRSLRAERVAFARRRARLDSEPGAPPATPPAAQLALWGDLSPPSVVCV